MSLPSWCCPRATEPNMRIDVIPNRSRNSVECALIKSMYSCAVLMSNTHFLMQKYTFSLKRQFPKQLFFKKMYGIPLSLYRFQKTDDETSETNTRGKTDFDVAISARSANNSWRLSVFFWDSLRCVTICAVSPELVRAILFRHRGAETCVRFAPPHFLRKRRHPNPHLAPLVGICSVSARYLIGIWLGGKRAA